MVAVSGRLVTRPNVGVNATERTGVRSRSALSLPLAEPQPEWSTNGPGNDDAATAQRVMHALIVDDDGFIREVARLSLELTGGWAVSLAESGRDGIDQARMLTPDVILLDVMMPGIDGVETMRSLADDPATRDIPVIFLTAATLACEQNRIDEAGALGVITKPFDPLYLAHEVEVLLGTAPR